jgi:exosortase/archaeosortase family protein
MKQQRVFRLAMAALAIMLMFLPFIVSFNDILTKAIESIGWYRWIQAQIVPMEVKMVGVVVRALGIEYTAHADGFTVNKTYAQLTWNCIGWQSLFLFLISLPFGFASGPYTLFSKIEAVLIGFLGTFLVNLGRVIFTVVLLAISRPLFAIVFHDYLAAIVTVVWLIGFWWFSYTFVLEEKAKK